MSEEISNLYYMVMDEGRHQFTEEVAIFFREVNEIANQGRGRHTITQSLSMVQRLAILQGTKTIV